MHEKHYEHVLEMQEFYTLRIDSFRLGISVFQNVAYHYS